MPTIFIPKKIPKRPRLIGLGLKVKCISTILWKLVQCLFQPLFMTVHASDILLILHLMMAYIFHGRYIPELYQV